jgi:hypothetical protein
MSQENVELTYELYDAFNRRDLGAYLALADVDVSAFPRLAPLEGGFHGHGGIRRLWKDLLDIWPDFTVQVAEVRDLGDQAVVALHQSGHGAGSDIPWGETVWQVVRWRKGKCVWWGTFDTGNEAFAAMRGTE